MPKSLKVKINNLRRDEYRKNGYWGDATLNDYWQMAVSGYPNKVFVRDNLGSCQRFKEVDHLAGKLASYMKKRGIIPGDVISVQLPAWSEFFIIGIACFKIGAVINPILPNYRGHELVHILNKCRTKMMFIPYFFRKFYYSKMLNEIIPEIPELKDIVIVNKGNNLLKEYGTTLEEILSCSNTLNECASVSADDVAAVLFTSGSEGEPKGVMLTHNNIISSERAYSASFNITSFDRLLMPAPIAHATGFHHAFVNGLLTGATCILQDHFEADTCLKLIERYQCTCIIGATPFVYDILRSLEKKRYDISSLRFFLCGGSPLHSYVIKKALGAGLKVISVYGSTESVPHTAVGIDAPMDKFIHTDGKAMRGVEIKAVDPFRHTVPVGIQGEEASRGPNVFVGYLDEPELTNHALDDEGWYYSGDLCVMDKDGYIKITGRKKDIIIRGGENISSSEIEGLLLCHPNIHEACVVPMPDRRLGERACAYVVLNDPTQKLNLKDIQNFFEKLKVAKYKYPERIEIIDRLPRSATCKIKKNQLYRDILSKLEKEGLLERRDRGTDNR
ncbi:medium-chain fatty-acid--CoA ligase [Sporolactobacillus sp. CQH2019]|nr:medium-chain fatty-acid--CoA ligase [Sporolactobacillus sp. CQH2019]